MVSKWCGGSSRIGGFGSSGNNRYKGDFDSDGDDDNYSDDEDTGYMLLWKCCSNRCD